MVTQQALTAKKTLKEVVADFLLSRNHLQPKTRRFYRCCLKNFWWYAETQGWPGDIGEITRAHIEEFLSYVRTEKDRWGYRDTSRSSCRYASRSTVHHYGWVVKILFNWALPAVRRWNPTPTRISI